jgi:hypothetical protein
MIWGRFHSRAWYYLPNIAYLFGKNGSENVKPWTISLDIWHAKTVNYDSNCLLMYLIILKTENKDTNKHGLSLLFVLGAGKNFWNLEILPNSFLASKLKMEGRYFNGMMFGILQDVLWTSMVFGLRMMLVVL